MASLNVVEPEIPPTSVGDEPLYEVVNDRRVVQPPMAASSTWIASLLACKIQQTAEQRGLGRAVTEMLFRLRSQPSLQRRPDAAFVSFERWPKGRRISSVNAWDVVPDLVVEVVSPTNLAEEIPTRVREYFEAGVRRAWVIYPTADHSRVAHEWAWCEIRVGWVVTQLRPIAGSRPSLPEAQTCAMRWRTAVLKENRAISSESVISTSKFKEFI
jgi:Uma2 family endonuclease